ncbi:MAG: class I SAM-dependent methyltransferase [Pyrinomonadaceae bacterium]
MKHFEESLNALDLTLFDKIPSQSTDEDKRSLLACQAATRRLVPEYRYLEIGSYLGGSIQPYVLDDKCVRVYSIDKRPRLQPDERGYNWTYENNSTERMMHNLRAIDAERAGKVAAIDGDTRSLDPAAIESKVDLCFIDGEHTDGAVFADFSFCLRALGGRGAIMFHDSQITYNGIAACVEHLRSSGVDFRAYILPNIVFVIEIGDFPLHRDAVVGERLVNNHEAYLFSLQDNDHYRRFANRLPFRVTRNLLMRLRGANVSR